MNDIELDLLKEVRDDVKGLHTRVTQLETKLDILLPKDGGGHGTSPTTKIVAGIVALITAIAGAWGGAQALGSDSPSSPAPATQGADAGASGGAHTATGPKSDLMGRND